MKTFELKSGTKVMIDESKIVIERTSGKSAVKGLFAEEQWDTCQSKLLYLLD